MLSQLDEVPSTLIHRLLAHGGTLQRALEELAAIHDAWAKPLKETLIRRRIMLQQQKPETLDETDQDDLDRINRVADEFFESLYAESEERGKTTGRREASVELLSRLLHLRLGHALTDPQRDALATHVANDTLDSLADRIVLLSPEEIVAWLEAVEV